MEANNVHISQDMFTQKLSSLSLLVSHMKLYLYDLSLSCDSPTTSFRLPTSIYLYFYVETLNSLNQLCQDWDDDKPPVYQPLTVLLR